MSLYIQDLGITEDVREVISEVSQGKIYFLTAEKEEDNPFSSSSETITPVFKGESDFISFEDRSKQVRYKFGESEEGIVACKIAKPEYEVNEGDYVFLSFSGGIYRANGIVREFGINISSIVEIEIDMKENVPFSWYSWIKFSGIKSILKTSQLNPNFS